MENKFLQIEETGTLISSLLGTVLSRSSIYETEAWGFDADESFYNRILMLDTSLSPEESLKSCLKIEKLRGRERSHSGYESRIIDIDILFYDSRIIETEHLKIPHPKMHLRRFVLEPLNELIPHFEHPVFKKKVAQLLRDCTDTCGVRRLGS